MGLYNAEYTRAYYDDYGELEWPRLEVSAYGRLQAIIHTDYIKRYVRPGDRVLDAGCGPGRFSIAVAEQGAMVTALDLSDHQLQLARERLGQAGVLDRVEGFVSADITDLSMFPDASFDVVICFGGALSYVCEQRNRAASELVRVVRPGGVVLASAMSLNGVAVNLVRRPNLPVLKDPESEQVWRVLQDGDLGAVPMPETNMQHPPMHMFTSDEMRRLLPECQVLELAGSNVTAIAGSTTIGEVVADRRAWSTAIRLERELNSRPGLIDSGSHIIMVAQRR